jgi:hypothetical protein
MFHSVCSSRTAGRSHQYTRTKPDKQTPTRGSSSYLQSVLLSKAFHIFGVLSVYPVEFLSVYTVEFVSALFYVPFYPNGLSNFISIHLWYRADYIL